MPIYLLKYMLESFITVQFSGNTCLLSRKRFYGRPTDDDFRHPSRQLEPPYLLSWSKNIHPLPFILNRNSFKYKLWIAGYNKNRLIADAISHYKSYWNVQLRQKTGSITNRQMGRKRNSPFNLRKLTTK